ncbi:putative chaperone protein DNAj [Trypanosoma theileri]|uniref:Putative chaperone protein DNAj n=1 Tax=Trypanosoma theileri TaxID=67003 RepID=A0A1X0NSX2_9TRYP|nr:putative chaperone protein DNAj [Trypanosoma theileri]ORC87804.1 putative chaperone protein DNAj [Trypanosoma theileri]
MTMRRAVFLRPLLITSRGVLPSSLLFTTPRRSYGGAVPYGSVPADIGESRHAQKPREEDVLRGSAKRTGTTSSSSSQTSSSSSSSSAGNVDRDGSEAVGYNPWEVLGVKPGASTQTIRLRYHELMREVHPDLEPSGTGDIPRLNQINKAYEIITKSPTLDKRYRNLVTDTQYFYYKFLPEWMARNVDEMPRYWSWVKWRTPGAFHIFLCCCVCYMVGRFYAAFPLLTTAFVLSVVFDILFHTMTAPATCSMLFLYSIMSAQSYDMAWLTSPKTFLRRELGY